MAVNAAEVLLAWAAFPLRQALMYLKAILIGDGVPHVDFDATVHSVFQSAINLRLTRGVELLTLVGSGQADLPQGIRVDTPESLSFETVASGEQATCRNQLLRLGSLTIDLGGARRWKCDLPALQADMTKPAVATAWRCAWQALDNRPWGSEYGFITRNLAFSDKVVRLGGLVPAEEAIRDLVDATRHCDRTVTRPLGALIGLGAGLTPSGDDLLVGYLAGLWCSVQSRSERVQFVTDLGKEVVRLSSHTNDISRTHLCHAARGQVSSLLDALARAICHGEDTEHLVDTAEAAMRVGHTSGTVAVAGLLLGLAVWDGGHLLKEINPAGMQASPPGASL